MDTLNDKQTKMIETLEKHNGDISITCKAHNISRTTFYEWKKNSPAFKQAVDNVKDSVLDLVESALMNKIQQGDTACIIFYLKTQGKNRGYGFNVEPLAVDKELRTIEIKVLD